MRHYVFHYQLMIMMFSSATVCQLSLSAQLFYAYSAAICQLSSIAMYQLKCTLSAQLSLVNSVVMLSQNVKEARVKAQLIAA